MTYNWRVIGHCLSSLPICCSTPWPTRRAGRCSSGFAATEAPREHLEHRAIIVAFADRALYLGDPAFVNVPVKGLIDPGYIKTRAALLNPTRSIGEAKAGDPPFQKTEFRFAPSNGIEFGTSHISVVDREGRLAWHHNSAHMAVAYLTEGMAKPNVFLEKSEEAWAK